MIDALETMIKWLAADMSGIAGRCANKHRFGLDWQPGTKAASVHPDDLTSTAYGRLHEARVEMRLYGASAAEIGDLYNELAELCRNAGRKHVVTSQGTALVHFCTLASGLTITFDDDLARDIGVVYVFGMIAQDAVS
jgi:hypothetical protein